MAINNATNRNLFVIVSPTVNFKTVLVTDLFTTSVNSMFLPMSILCICDTATAPNLNSIFNMGWTAATYSDVVGGATFVLSHANTTGEGGVNFNNCAIFPANTTIKVNVTSGDTGTALTGRFIFYGMYV